MNLSSSSTSSSSTSPFDTSTSSSITSPTPPPKNERNNPSDIGGISFQNETHANSTIYDSALENLTAYSSFDVSANNNSTTKTFDNSKLLLDSSTDFKTTSNGSDHNNSNINASMLLIQSESTDTNTSQEEVDPKSKLANKTIFKSDNPNLSIIEISQNSIKEQEDAEMSVILIETSDEDELDDKNAVGTVEMRKSPVRKSTPSPSPSKQFVDNSAAAEKRRRKAESLIHSSKQKLNIAIAEASAAESQQSTKTNANYINNSHLLNGEIKSHINENTDTEQDIKIHNTIEEFEKNLPSTVTLLETPFGSKVYLVGTAHFSEESQNDVSYVIRNVRPDVVVVELCPSRIHILKLDEKTLLEEAKDINLNKIRSVIQAHGFINGIFFILLLQMSAQIAKDLGMAPGGEFRRAFDEIHKIPNCMLQLGDRPIRITLHRALRALSLWQTIKLAARLTSNDTISIEEVEECKKRDLLEKLMQEMAGEFPAFSDVFVKERDMFLCHSLQLASLPNADITGHARPVRVVGVVGIGHADGIAQMWGRVDPKRIPDIMQIPPASLSTRICKYTIKYGFIGLAIFGAFKVLRPRLSRLF